jgi:hypothetical protein
MPHADCGVRAGHRGAAADGAFGDESTRRRQWKVPASAGGFAKANRTGVSRWTGEL